MATGHPGPLQSKLVTLATMKSLLILPLLALGMASASFAGTSCGSGCVPPTEKPACKCGAPSVEECHKHCGDKCDCAKPAADAPKPETKK